jgi:hypothetical protein
MDPARSGRRHNLVLEQGDEDQGMRMFQSVCIDQFRHSRSDGGDAIASHLVRRFHQRTNDVKLANDSTSGRERYEKYSGESSGYCIGYESAGSIRSGREDGTDDSDVHHERGHRQNRRN